MPMTDEIFGRSNRCYVITFKQSSVSGPKAINPGLVTTSSYILLYAKDKTVWSPHKVFTPTPRDKRYNKYITNPNAHHSKWSLTTLREALAAEEGLAAKDLKKRFSTKESMEKRLVSFVLSDPSRVVRTARVAPSDISESCRPPLRESGSTPNIVFRGERQGSDDMYFLNGEQLIFYSSKAKKVDGEWITGIAASTIWDDLLSNNLHNEGQVRFPNGKKPEGLIKRLLDMTTNLGDWVLDSFAGSGTTGAVAHKMHRQWIMVELGVHCDELIRPRMTRVIDGADDSGVTKATDWRGGGGFRYYTLAPSLLQQDQVGNWIINKQYNAPMLAQAVCKIEGFTYAPSDSVYWQQGHSTESDFIYVTTQTLTRQQIEALSEDVGPSRSLVVYCHAFRVKNVASFANLTLKKIPKTVLHKCEWGKDDYSLEIKNLPAQQPEPEEAPTPPPRRRRRRESSQPSLFAMEGGEA